MDPIALKLHDANQELIAALDADLETGTHHGNNAASEAFAQRYWRFMEAWKRLSTLIEAQLPDEYWEN
jgi:hypothetical protein